MYRALFRLFKLMHELKLIMITSWSAVRGEANARHDKPQCHQKAVLGAQDGIWAQTEIWLIATFHKESRGDWLDLSPIRARGDPPLLLALLPKGFQVPRLLPKHVILCIQPTSVLAASWAQWLCQQDAPTHCHCPKHFMQYSSMSSTAADISAMPITGTCENKHWAKDRRTSGKWCVLTSISAEGHDHFSAGLVVPEVAILLAFRVGSFTVIVTW